MTTPVTVTVVNTTGVATTVYGFIDWNGNGDSRYGRGSSIQPGERQRRGRTDFNAPVDANTAQLLPQRFRISTATGLTATGVASNSRDQRLYLVQAIRLDSGDLPETPYETTRSADGAHHVILPTNNPIFGATVDSEVTGQYYGNGRRCARPRTDGMA